MTSVNIIVDETLNTEQTVYSKELDAFLTLRIVPVGIVDAQIGAYQKQISDAQDALNSLNAISATRTNPKP